MSESTPTAETPPSSPMPIVGLILSSDAEFNLALTLGSNMPKTRNGIPLHPYWKEALKPAKLKDAKGQLWDITAADIDSAVSDAKRALSLGHEPLIQDDHYKPTKSYGFIKGARKNANGGMDLLHVFMGDAERDEALRRKTSVMLLPNFKDEKNNEFKWWPDHSAIVFRPQFRGLNDFQPALAASGQTVEAHSLVLADDSKTEPKAQETIMDISVLRASLGETAKGKSDEEILALAAKELTDGRTALALSAQSLKDRNEANGVLVGELNAAEAARDNALALSAKEPDADEPTPQVLALSGKLSEMSISLALKENKINDKQAESLRSRIKATPALALSADETSGTTQIDDLIAFAALGADDPKVIKPIVRGTPAKPLALGADAPPAKMTPERKAELLAEAGYPTKAA